MTNIRLPKKDYEGIKTLKILIPHEVHNELFRRTVTYTFEQLLEKTNFVSETKTYIYVDVQRAYEWVKNFLAEEKAEYRQAEREEVLQAFMQAFTFGHNNVRDIDRDTLKRVVDSIPIKLIYEFEAGGRDELERRGGKGSLA